MDKKTFEQNARTFLKYGIGNNIEESRQKVQLMIDVNEMIEKRKREKK